MSRAKGRPSRRRPPPPPARAGRSRLLLVLVIVSAALAHLNALPGGFLDWDDGEYVQDNPLIHPLSVEGIGRMFTTFHSSNWHPLTWLSHALDRAVFGLSPAAHHAMSVALHALAAGALFAALSTLTGSAGAAAVVALVFGVHPLRVESVAWISERKDILCGLFFFLTLLSHARYARAPSRSRYAAVLVLCLCALLSKPMAVTLPAALLLSDWWPLRRLSGRAVLEKVPLLALAAATAVLTIAAQPEIAFAEIPLASRLTNAIVSVAGYVRNLIWPVGLSPYYPFPGFYGTRPFSTGSVVICGAFVMFASAFAVAWRRRAPYLLFGWLWYLLTLLPVCGVAQTGSQAMADRYTYIPLIGVLVAIVWGAADLLRRFGVASRREARSGSSYAVAGLVGAWVLALTLLSWHQAKFWRTTRALWERALAVTPPSAVAHDYLGNALLNEDRVDEAIGHLRTALLIDPLYKPPLIRLGSALAGRGELDEAQACYRRVLAARPADAEALAGLGALALERGQWAEAAELIERSLEAQPRNASAISNLSVAYANSGDLEAALRLQERALAMEPEVAESHRNRAGLLRELGRRDEAAAAARRAIELRADDAEAWRFLGVVERERGRLGEAAQAFHRAAQLDSSAVDARRDYAATLLLGREYDRAIEALRENLARDSTDAESGNMLAWALATSPDARHRDGEEAVRIATAVIASDASDPNRFDTYAAALAEAGRFDDAVAAARRAAALALAIGDSLLAGEARRRAALYEAGEAYRSP